MRRILFVDDEPLLLEVIEARLVDRAEEWEMHFAEGADEALDAAASQFFDVVVADRRMPGMDGIELLEVIQERSPRTVRILMTGQMDEAALQGAQFHVPKPCNMDQLAATIDEALSVGSFRG